MFTLSILVSFIGTWVGMEYVPPAMVLPLVVVEVIMLISAFFIRRSRSRSIGYLFVYAFCFISGITIFPSIMHYTQVGGSGLVTTAFLLTVLIFGALTAYAYNSKRDFSFLGGMLFVGMLVLIGFSLIGLFVPAILGGTLGLIIAGGGVLIFSGFILYDISQYKHGLADEEIPFAVLNLYLSFINLFLYLLRFLGILSSDD
jgi:modulator of FtsH protease